MTKQELKDSELQWIEDWVNKVETLTGLKCQCIRQVWSQNTFTKEDLVKAQNEDAFIFKGLANDLERLC